MTTTMKMVTTEVIMYLIWGLCFASIICCNPSNSQQDGSDRLYPATWEAKSRIPRCHTQKQVANRWQNPSLSDSIFHSLGKRLRTEEEKAAGNGAGWPPALTTLFTATSCRPLSQPAAHPRTCPPCCSPWHLFSRTSRCTCLL